MISQPEALLAVLGMRPIISHEIETITEQQWARVLSIEADVEAGARELVHGNPKPVPDLEGIDYMPTLIDLATPYEPAQVEAMLAELPPWFSDQAGAFIQVAHRAFEYMGTQMPRQLKVDLTGSRPMTPPDRLVDRFVSLLEVLDDPLRALKLAANAQLLKPQIDALDVVFPSLMDYMRKAIADEISSARGEQGAGFRMHYHAEMGAEKLLGHDLTSPVLRKMLAEPPPKPSQGSAPGPQGAGGGGPEQMTRVQRTDNIGAE